MVVWLVFVCWEPVGFGFESCQWLDLCKMILSVGCGGCGGLTVMVNYL